MRRMGFFAILWAMKEKIPHPPVRRSARPTKKPLAAPRANEAPVSPSEKLSEGVSTPPVVMEEAAATSTSSEAPVAQKKARRNAPPRGAAHGKREEMSVENEVAGGTAGHTTQEQQGPQTRGLTLLGSKHTVYSDNYTPVVLETFENRHRENDYWVKFNCPEFTSLCPITGQPDFATIYISYIPDKRMVESKSLKLYLFSFRNHGAFHEDCVNLIMKDLIKLMEPRYIEVWGKFLPRGGISIDPFANYGKPTTRWAEFARQRLMMHDLSPETVNNR